MNLSPTPVFKGFDNNGRPLVGGKLFTYVAGTSVKQATYTSSDGSQTNSNPIILDYRGEARVWLDPLLSYKFVLSAPADTDPPSNPIWSVDHINGELTGFGNIVPTVDNAFTLGTPSFSWANIYLGADHAPVLDASTGLIGYYKRSAAEIAAGVTPTHYSIWYGIPERYGAVGDGLADDTQALINCFNSNAYINFTNGAAYGVTTFLIPRDTQYCIRFNGARIKGIATTPQDCIVRLKINTSDIYDYNVDMNFNVDNYTCATWWYDEASSSQFNNVFGMNHSYCRRAVVYGEMDGHTSTGFAQSENNIFGFRTRGVQNPFLGNHSNGGLFFHGPMFVALNEEWPVTPAFDWSAALACENYNGLIQCENGELIKAASELGFSAALSNASFVNFITEVTCPISVVGDLTKFIGGRALVGRDDTPLFRIGAGNSGKLVVDDMDCIRADGVGAYSAQPIVDATLAASTFETILTNTRSIEWRWSMISGNVKLIQGAIARYFNHRMKITLADPNIYILNFAPTDSILGNKDVDRLGYTTTGWFSHNDSGATTFSVTTNAGPTDYLASQFSLVATGVGRATTADITTLASIKTSAYKVHPAETYFLQSWGIITAGTNLKFIAEFYDLTGAQVGVLVPLADSGSILSTWSFIQAPIAVPATAAYMGVGAYSNVSTGLWTDFRVIRAN